MRCGDHVYHRPTEETLVVREADDKYFSWCGWPPGRGLVADCEIIYRCTDAEHETLKTALKKE